MYCYTGRFAGVLLVFNFRYEKTADYYVGVLHPCTNTENGIIIPKKACEEWMQRWHIVDPAYAEYVLSCSYACDSLMKKNRIIFHGATFLWHKKAWLFSAPSGTGKTTQLLNWKRIFGDEIVILNGDKPILELCEDGSILTHPSPWKGKEGLGRDDLIAPLGGIIYLRQENENRITRMTLAEAARFLFGRSYSSFSTEEEIINTANLLEKILKVTPVWILGNLGDEVSARLTYRTLVQEGF